MREKAYLQYKITKSNDHKAQEHNCLLNNATSCS